MDIIRTIRDIGQELSASIPELNYGGCCVYAHRVAQALRAYGIEARGRVVSYSRHDLEQVRAEYGQCGWRAWQDAGFYISHVIIEFEHDGMTWRHDSTLTTTAGSEQSWAGDGGRGPLMAGSLTVEELADLVHTQNGWNTSFWWGHCEEIESTVNNYLPANQRQAA
jgi:hypothetical protein